MRLLLAAGVEIGKTARFVVHVQDLLLADLVELSEPLTRRRAERLFKIRIQAVPARGGRLRHAQPLI